jgi:hypothetical protein
MTALTWTLVSHAATSATTTSNGSSWARAEGGRLAGNGRYVLY